MRYFGSVNTELTSLDDRAEEGQPETKVAVAKRGQLWMLRQDLAGYVVLGGPAARRPLQPRAVVSPEPPRELAQVVAQQ